MIKEKLHNIVYKTTNLVNGKIYIGVHSTDDLNDGYMGSGRAIYNSIKKHGIENFTKEILHNVEDAELMYFIEEELVNEEFIVRDDTYNMSIGGKGGCKHNEFTGEKISKTMTGRKLTEECRKKIGLSLIGRPSPNKGKTTWNKGLKTGIPSPKRKRILCITTGEIFSYLKEALIKYPNVIHIGDCCRGTVDYAGTLPDGTKLTWRYL